jgi:hypothetical protein
VGDITGATIHAFALRDKDLTSQTDLISGNFHNFEGRDHVVGLDQKLAALFGTTVDKIVINDLAVHQPLHPPLGCRAAGEVAMRRRFERAKSEGDLPANVNPADLARYIATVLYGMAVQAAGGASRSQLQRVIEMALRTLPM